MNNTRVVKVVIIPADSHRTHVRKAIKAPGVSSPRVIMRINIHHVSNSHELLGFPGLLRLLWLLHIYTYIHVFYYIYI